MAVDDDNPAGSPGFDDTVDAQAVSVERSPSQQRLHEDVRGRLFEGRAPRRSLEPGALVAGRYRIVEHLGAGGMGEVFRAHDLVLEEDVAVKFLPETRADDDAFMRRFVNEVRLARQISHPAVCRVHDIGEVDGRAFLSMEYIDGEDLASLLRRIGRLPPEKAYELAQQLCAGLAELHGAGLLHRDLKPANLMIDGQGRLKIADFGLAAIREELRAHEFGDGTPAYMAPEQLAGREVSQRSDIYALGVVLYELLSGRHPYEAMGGDSTERGKIDRTAPAVALGARVSGLADETLEIVELCLEDAPADRPGSVLDVAAMLPGGDPIAAALRAGRAPSVEAVANAQTSELLQPWRAWALAAITMAALVLYAALGPPNTLWGQAAPQLAPAALEDRAREAVSDFGLQVPGGSTMQRLVRDDSYLESPPPRMALAPGRPVPILYEFRASPKTLARRGAIASHDDPPMTTPGEVRVVLDVRGRLRTFERVPELPPGEGEGGMDWSVALARAGVEDAVPSELQRLPPRVSDEHHAWQGRVEGGEAPVRVEAASWRGRSVWFDVEPPWGWEHERAPSSSGLSRVTEWILLVLFLFGLGFLARRSYRRGEVDGRGAVRVAVALGLCVTVSELLTMSVGQSSGFQTVLGMFKEGLLVAIISLLGYAVVEPFGRRYLPGAMVSWVRLTRGRWRDPLVGRDVLLGAAVGCLIGSLSLLRQHFGDTDGVLLVRLDALMGFGHAIGASIGAVWLGAFSVMQVYILFVVLRWVLRRATLAAGGFFLLWSLVEIGRLSQSDLSATAWVLAALSGVAVSAILAYVIVRVGLLALSTAQILLNLVLTLPLSLDFGGWYGTSSIIALGTAVLIVAVALHVALGRARASERTSQIGRTRA